VSPLRRTLETCRIIFENHKNAPKIYAHPLLRELQCSSCDIPSSVDVLERDFPEVDFSLVKAFEKSHLWFLYQISDTDVVQYVHEQIKLNVTVVEEEAKYAGLLLLQKMKELFPELIEPKSDAFKRSKTLLEDIMNRMKDFTEEGEVCLVGHGGILAALTSLKYTEDKYAKDWFQGVNLENAQIYFHSLP